MAQPPAKNPQAKPQATQPASPGQRPGPASTPPNAKAILGMEDTASFLHALLNEAMQLKAQASRGPLPPLLQGKAILMIYEKNST
ncbi:MAG: hypothetical protein ACYC2H_06845, partial [Thermoplasmatota archaeon]